MPGPLPPHADNLSHVRNSQVGKLLIVDLIIHQPRLAFADTGLVFEIRLLFLVLAHIEGLTLQYGVRPLNYRRENRIDRSQNNRREEHDAQPDGKGPQQRKHIHRLRIGKGLPHPIGDVEEGSQTCDTFGYTNHVAAQGHHLLIEVPQQLVQILKIDCKRRHGYQYLSLGLPYRASTREESPFARLRRYDTEIVLFVK